MFFAIMNKVHQQVMGSQPEYILLSLLSLVIRYYLSGCYGKIQILLEFIQALSSKLILGMLFYQISMLEVLLLTMHSKQSLKLAIPQLLLIAIFNQISLSITQTQSINSNKHKHKMQVNTLL